MWHTALGSSGLLLPGMSGVAGGASLGWLEEHPWDGWLRKGVTVLSPQPSEYGEAGEMLAVSSHFIISLPGRLRQSLAFSGDGYEVEVAGPGAAFAPGCTSEAGSWRGQRRGRRSQTTIPVFSCLYSFSKTFKQGLASPPPHFHLPVLQPRDPCNRCHLPGRQQHMAWGHPRVAKGLIRAGGGAAASFGDGAASGLVLVGAP